MGTDLKAEAVTRKESIKADPGRGEDTMTRHGVESAPRPQGNRCPEDRNQGTKGPLGLQAWCGLRKETKQ